MFTADFKSEPYWWERTPRPNFPVVDLPKAVDVAIVGSGYTGLNAAIQTARGGRSTLVLDAEDAGFGCSTRNGGQISTSVKPSLAELTKKYGLEIAFAIRREGHTALDWIAAFIRDEGIDCDFKVPGRFHAAHNARAFDKLVREVTNQPDGLEVPYQIVARQDQRQELGTDAYHGGVVFENHASLEPARFHQGLLDLATRAGAQIAPRTRVDNVERTGDGFVLRTARGDVRARDVVIATNGYTGALTPWLRRRVIPIGSYVIATEPLEPALMDRLMPSDRIVSDSRTVVYYYRPSPDRRRIVFGGRVSSGEIDTRVSGMRLKRDLDRLFPELSATKISHSWMGFVAYTFDTMANVGKRDGMHYAMGYCGSGVSMASYLGMRVGQQILGLPEGRTAFDKVPFSTRPLYSGRPWFLPASVAWHRLVDRMGF
ncbi:Oxidoreductase [Candidatus Rhodobacter oscarellae]|uniref:Oxidoreductase n=1 Tax=Candidatus Rhodobacter oscarellae TaxID=1675527 RepID=A0A0J9E9A6_9RHOB|nr:FAD-binding oxidoreductase [Candidatus Rhodobacter lobularis]KMW59377.1 Oxidoreductase [Candidatus Rhodobacter lobularis]